MKKKIEFILIASLIILTCVGIVFGICNLVSQGAYINEKSITLRDNTTSEMEIQLLDIAPDTQSEYTINLKANKGDSFDVTLDFVKTGADSLAQYIDVDVTVNGESVGKSILSQLLDGKQINFCADFSDSKKNEVVIAYKMDADVGDEAQATSADFDVILTSKR